LFNCPLSTFPEHFMQIRSKIFAQVANRQTEKQRRKHNLIGGGKTLKNVKRVENEKRYKNDVFIGPMLRAYRMYGVQLDLGGTQCNSDHIFVNFYRAARCVQARCMLSWCIMYNPLLNDLLRITVSARWALLILFICCSWPASCAFIYERTNKRDEMKEWRMLLKCGVGVLYRAKASY